ncbi:MAG TPA: hypothetical protein VMY16_11145 [Ilumatobacteraceae bacterium]|nr:hypothetical protein [Ilumatobacteraceae bacterium]
MHTNHILLTIGTASLLFVGACGSDDDAGSDASAGCDEWIAADTAVINYLFTGDGDAESVNAALDEAIAAADPEIEQTIVDLKAAAQAEIADPEAEGSDESLELYNDTITWAGDNCAVDELGVAAVDYGFDGAPDELPTGYHIVQFSNEGQEQHEMFALRFNEGTTETIDELFELPEDEVFSKITPVNATFAPPGGSSAVSWNLSEPGRYAIVCFIPTGSVGETEGDGPPHFTQGMIREFTVTS